MSFARVYPLYIAEVEKKGRTKAEVDEAIHWLTGYTEKQLKSHLDKVTDFETFFAKAPHLNPNRSLIKGVICGVRIEDIEEPTMREIRYLDKLVDELGRTRRHWTQRSAGRSPKHRRTTTSPRLSLFGLKSG